MRGAHGWLMVKLDVMGRTGKRKNRDVVCLPRVFAMNQFPSLKGSTVKPGEVMKWDHLRGLSTPDVGKNGVGLLIGQDVPKALRPLEVRFGSEDQPYATRTVLGWSLNGPVNAEESEEAVSAFVNGTPEEQLLSAVEKFWKIDNDVGGIGLSVDDKKVLKIWRTLPGKVMVIMTRYSLCINKS